VSNGREVHIILQGRKLLENKFTYDNIKRNLNYNELEGAD
jgi:hypothetical protein